MEAIPRISRAQKMDALSSQGNLAGYKAVLMGADALDQIMPMTVTAAGTIKPANVVIMGAGVAGRPALATPTPPAAAARRLAPPPSPARTARRLRKTLLALNPPTHTLLSPPKSIKIILYDQNMFPKSHDNMIITRTGQNIKASGYHKKV